MARNSKKLVGEICLYGNGNKIGGVGCGWIATTADRKLFGDGEPKQHMGWTDCVYRGLAALQESGIKSGIVRIFAAGGERMVEVQIGDARWPYYGELQWQSATVLEISCEDLMAAAQ